MTSPHSPSPHAMSTPREQDTREICFWSCREGDEWLSCEDIDEAVEQWADDMDGPLPDTVEVVGYVRMPLPSEEHIATDVLDFLLERIDEEHANPEGDPTKPSAAMREAAIAFSRVFRAEYKSWACEEITRRTVRVADHVTADSLAPSAPRETPT